jgi:hypothetical protein
MDHETSHPETLTEVALAYFEDRLRAIKADICAVEIEHDEGRLMLTEFAGIHRSLMDALKEVRAALEIVARVKSTP